MDLYVARVSEVSALTVALNGCCTVATHSVCREEVCVAVTAGSDYYRAREANVYRLAEVSNDIIDQCVAQGVPFAREYGLTLSVECT